MCLQYGMTYHYPPDIFKLHLKPTYLFGVNKYHPFATEQLPVHQIQTFVLNNCVSHKSV